jgi:hypothetical protein
MGGYTYYKIMGLMENLLKPYNIGTTENCLKILNSNDIIKIISYLPTNNDSSNDVDILLSFLVQFAIRAFNISPSNSSISRIKDIKIIETLHNLFNVYTKTDNRFHLAVIICLFYSNQIVSPNMLDIVNPIVDKLKDYDSASNAELGLVALSLSSLSIENTKFIYDLDILEYLTKILDRDELRVIVHALLVLENTGALYTDEVVEKLVKARIFNYFTVLFGSLKLSKKFAFHLPIRCILSVLSRILGHGSKSFDPFLNAKIVPLLLNMMDTAASEPEDNDNNLRKVYSEILVEIGMIFNRIRVPYIYMGSLTLLGVPFVTLDILDKIIKHRVEGKTIYNEAICEFLVYLHNLAGLSKVGNDEISKSLQRFRSLETIQRLKPMFDQLNELELGGAKELSRHLNLVSICICRLMDGREANIIYGAVLERVNKLKKSPNDDATIAWNEIKNADIILSQYLNKK